MSALVWAAVVVCGGLGALGRFVFDGFVSQHAGRELPIGTFTINVSGAFLLGLLTGLAVTGNALIIAGTATLGSYTTFSTWMLETHRLREDAEWLGAVGNVVVSLLVGFGAVALGRLIGEQF